jgi:cytochrome P450
VKLPAGSELLLFIGSANRDERIFEDPDRFDVGRDTRGHLGFGLGNHFCLGSNLARLEAKAALEALVPELPKLARLRSERDFIDSFTIRGRARLELRRAA